MHRNPLSKLHCCGALLHRNLASPIAADWSNFRGIKLVQHIWNETADGKFFSFIFLNSGAEIWNLKYTEQIWESYSRRNLILTVEINPLLFQFGMKTTHLRPGLEKDPWRSFLSSGNVGYIYKPSSIRQWRRLTRRGFREGSLGLWV